MDKIILNKPELLAPAGSPEALRAAISAGADAVYLGGGQFNARINAKNFTRQELCEAIDTCHKNAVRCYITFNTLVSDIEYKNALEYATFLYNAGADAFIMADLGLAAAVKERLPDIPLHASTQCSGHSADAAKFLAGKGFSRIVAARELKKEDLALFCKNSPIETEVFIHGALCVSASGQCLLSSFIGGRSGNRGECAQPCRMQYNGKYPLSLKDNCLAAHMKELLELGISSFKIEGRMKSDAYVYNTVSVYRKLIDSARNATEAEIKLLSDTFSRSGFTDGYFIGKTDSQMLGVRSESDKALSLPYNRKGAEHALSREREPIVLEREKKEFLDYPRKSCREKPKSVKYSARFYNPENIVGEDFFDIIYTRLEDARARGAKAKAEFGVMIPPVITDTQKEKVRSMLAAAKACGVKHALVGNIGHIELAREFGFTLHGDFRLNVASSASFEFYRDAFEDVMLSPELTLVKMRDIPHKKSIVAYGRVPLMLLEKRVGSALLTDRKKAQFPILSEFGRDLLFNCVPIYMADKRAELDSALADDLHFIFSTEGKRECEYIISCYKHQSETKKEKRRIK